MTPVREALFICHTNPEDNAFARWLGAKLAAMGYEVWADVMRLHGGADWSRELEQALRNRAIKVLVACTPLSMERQGVRNEIEIASELARTLNDRELIIPLRLAPYQPHFRIAHLQYIDFSRSWADGLAELVDLLVNIHKLPRRSGRPMEDWLVAQSTGATRLVQKQERLTSNWLLFRTLPRTINYCEPPSGFPLEQFQNKALHRWPVIPFGAGVVTFASPDAAGLLAPDMPARLRAFTWFRESLRDGWDHLGISKHEARRQFSDLGNQAFEAFLQRRGLKGYMGSGGRLSWWGDIRTLPLTQIRFDWPQQKGRRQVIGVSDKRKMHWHYAISAHMRTSPVRHLRLSSRLIFSENGLDAIGDVKRMHRLRRSFAKSWRNARWRDMLSAFLWWLKDGRADIEVPIAEHQRIALSLPTVSFSSPVSVLHAGEEIADEDDPDIQLDYWDEDEDEASEQEPADSIIQNDEQTTEE
jgi:hypothetical protein